MATMNERMATLRADRDRRLARLDELVELGQCTPEHRDIRRKELLHIYKDRENCIVCKGPCSKPLAGGAEAHPLNKPLTVRP